MTKLELTNEQKHEISAELNASDFYETVPFLNQVLKVLGYVDYMEDDSEREELRWTKRKEPLIKDKKIRKAVRAWAEACGIVSCYLECGEFATKHREIDCCIGFGDTTNEMLEEKHYTIAELCGEEEE